MPTKLSSLRHPGDRPLAVFSASREVRSLMSLGLLGVLLDCVDEIAQKCIDDLLGKVAQFLGVHSARTSLPADQLPL